MQSRMTSMRPPKQRPLQDQLNLEAKAGYFLGGEGGNQKNFRANNILCLLMFPKFMFDMDI